MAFSNTDLFSWNPVVEVSDEEHKLFYSIDRQLISTLILTLGRDPFDSIRVIAFLLWLERTRLGVKAVYKVNLDWPNHLVDMLADQVVALLEWLKNPTLVWERRGDISMIEELCTQEVGFVYLHERRLEILRENTQIANEMAEKAFKDFFPNGVVERSTVQDRVGQGSGGASGNAGNGGGPVYVPRELVNRPHFGVQAGSPVGFFHGRPAVGPPVHGDVASGSGGAAAHVPRELVSRHPGGVQIRGAGYGSPAPGLVFGRFTHDPRHLMMNSNIRMGVPVPIFDPRQFHNIIHNGPGYGMVRGPVQVHGEPVHMNEGGFRPVGRLVHVHPDGPGSGLLQLRQEPEDMYGYVSDDDVDEPEDGPILPNVPFGPRMGYVENDGGDPENPQRSRPARTRRAFTEDELSVLLRGLNFREEETGVHDDDKTVFLTFSRGYPMTEPQIWGFFTRRFGNFIKSIHMGEAREGAQPLYARMVARNSSILPVICDPDPNVKTKYVIDGRHVWAKKFVRRHHTPPPRLSPSTADPQPPPPPPPPTRSR